MLYYSIKFYVEIYWRGYFLFYNFVREKGLNYKYLINKNTFWGKMVVQRGFNSATSARKVAKVWTISFESLPWNMLSSYLKNK